ncbi:hypothetical protein SYNPS1DRAFT_31779 [Syncephalis pseudoplumigaleata]|uniref:Uncharacterized protein n=1 Tax=Syncephalis pseudoplumigaleata TaxID=1712513 RepID=A0A4P9YSH7_9FUNG|nr:hypothetical protein SYNPS1DRAFT_31779 [Syncephalis pseudoplumigaleata]|eukprot:RKP22618.1 hypothetical protein SYNPS1DRAFT_31779 [Syncephalis pseudoplumigaleata]
MPASASTTTSEANLVHQSRGPAGTYASSATHDTRLSGSATTTKQQAATAMPMTTTAAIVPPRPTLLPTPGVPTLARCQRDRIMNMRGNSLDRPVAEAYGIARRPCAGEMRTVAPPSPVFARRISATKQNEQPCPHPPMTDNARTTYYNNNDGNDRGQWSKPFYDGPTFI